MLAVTRLSSPSPVFRLPRVAGRRWWWTRRHLGRAGFAELTREWSWGLPARHCRTAAVASGPSLPRLSAPDPFHSVSRLVRAVRAGIHRAHSLAGTDRRWCRTRNAPFGTCAYESCVLTYIGTTYSVSFGYGLAGYLPTYCIFADGLARRRVRSGAIVFASATGPDMPSSSGRGAGGWCSGAQLGPRPGCLPLD